MLSTIAFAEKESFNTRNVECIEFITDIDNNNPNHPQSIPESSGRLGQTSYNQFMYMYLMFIAFIHSNQAAAWPYDAPEKS